VGCREDPCVGRWPCPLTRVVTEHVMYVAGAR
jgi:hypothetical protein